MDYVRLGRTGLKVSQLCLGCMTYGAPDRGNHPWTLDEEKSRPLIQRAIEEGINFFDTANSYSDGTSEEIVGKALRDFARRDEVVIATKVYYPSSKAPNIGGLSRKAIMSEIDKSLRRLGTDYVDLYMIHRWDYTTPIEETLETLNDLIKAGKVRYIGASSMYAWQFAKMIYTADLHRWARPVSMQNHLNLLNREEEREMIPLCIAEDIGITPWSPLARGRLTRSWGEKSYRTETDEPGKKFYEELFEQADRKVVEAVAAIAERRAIPRSQVALAWVIRHAGVTSTLVGASKESHLTDAVAALQVELTDAEVAELEAPYVPHNISGFE
ncbi:aldo/keto reductase [Paraburkholderia sp. BL9I2N2]|uniref:aldo/keto reductase n=1 Tax=Paraburkholderia sp. BL9I2N2 TaxID=1938809 RepID=UPI0010464262|nr:aldo/keto reductase [Paraburkholderia sp. BL9I2N2]TCK84062.1 aryl-alcohol dehydrogenase-like predicted oxidoreductase [Paraburkholderia sp. BL9I2N2]